MKKALTIALIVSLMFLSGCERLQNTGSIYEQLGNTTPSPVTK